jgi:molybdate transport system permease protein
MPADMQAVWLTALLAGLTTLLLVPLATPLAWWLARTSSSLRPIIEAVVALPPLTHQRGRR